MDLSNIRSVLVKEGDDGRIIKYRFTERLARVKGAVLTLVAYTHWTVEILRGAGHECSSHPPCTFGTDPTPGER
jgi:hypothetical protein